ncbi:hypothetical protein HELRODRAFT_142525, partial [Helobdella robusta]|uniref:Small monomeric GTPase n=1 Tax=Helobdella robusta TaxID=6412 RepID=T1EJ60_HELRO
LDIPPSNCYRLVLLGSSRVGKTSIVSRFLSNWFDDRYTPTIEDFHRKIYRIRGETYRLDILDTSGNDPFPAMKRLSLLTGDLFIIVYSIDSRESFEEAIRLKDQVTKTKRSTNPNVLGSTPRKSKPNQSSPISMVIVGNKCDREGERVV